jgi:hypothetical protein
VETYKLNLPTYIKDFSQENYHEELNQTLQGGVSDNGFVIPSVTNAQLTINNWIAPDGTITTLALGMPDGTLWYVSDGAPADFVVKRSGVLRRVSTTAYP